MERIAFHLRLEDGQSEAYREAHENVPEPLESAYLDSEADLETYSVFEADGHVFGYMEVEDPDAIRAVMAESDAQASWEKIMDPITTDDGENWMDEVYRMC